MVRYGFHLSNVVARSIKIFILVVRTRNREFFFYLACQILFSNFSFFRNEYEQTKTEHDALLPLITKESVLGLPDFVMVTNDKAQISNFSSNFFFPSGS